VTVCFADLDLTKSEGIAALYGRISFAAHSVCRDLDPSVSGDPLPMHNSYKRCLSLSNAIEGATSKIDRPDFTAYIADKLKRGTRENVKIAER
jgi:UrcA family protein